MEKQNKKYLRILVLVQIVICLLIFILLFLLSRNISSHNIDILRTIAINDAKKYMNTVVDDTIVDIDLKRDSVTKQIKDLADLVVYQLDGFEEKNLDKSIHDIRDKLKQMQYGKSIQILIVNKNEVLKDSYTIYRKVSKSKYDLIVCVEQKDIDEIVKLQMYEKIHKSFYNKNDYIWINEILNYGGGDRYAIRVIHPNLSNTEGTYLSTFTRDIAGNFPYLKELKGINEKGEIFQTYYFKNKQDDEITEKLAYAKLYAPFDWVISIGRPLDDILRDSKEFNDYNNKIIFFTTIKILLSIMVVLLLGISIMVKSQKKYLLCVEEFVKKETELDVLTKVYTRKAAEKYLKQLMKSISKNKEKFMFILIDIDDFKKVNDSYGHIIGDEVLKKIANNISMCINSEDRLFRWGGEEFLLICKGITEDKKLLFAEKILSNVNCIVFKSNQKKFQVTISMGGTYITEEDTDFVKPIKRADKALYKAKNNGKNRYCHE